MKTLFACIGLLALGLAAPAATGQEDKDADAVSQRASMDGKIRAIDGKAIYEASGGPVTTRFICLHGGMYRRAVFVYTLPD